MVPAEELELKIFRFAESAGKARWRPADLGTLANSLQSVEQAVLVDALDDLYARRFMEFRQWSYPKNDWVRYAGDREYFSYPFELRVTFPGRKYFEGLEAQSSRTRSTEPSGVEVRVAGKSHGNSTVTAKLDTSPQVIAAPASAPPRAFVSHSGQDHQFVHKFAVDLCDYGVDAWYSQWEIKAGDSIPERIGRGLEDCEFFIYVLSNNSISSPWVQAELETAIGRKMAGKVQKIIPIKIDDCDKCPPMIGSLNRVTFTPETYELRLKDVVNSILDVELKPPVRNRLDQQKEERQR
ncbi:MAG TPA: toll/interleukin-1 receptor domain-containing protein [Candidatus Limnocylindrales bacterium]|nr:toll/interleukin-1 receptor domain-containing protein [Candidatus Limnocylindrales bacterium]